MSECILHFGMPKTGSSSIQTWLLRECADPRLRYLNLGTRGSGNIMVGAFFPDPLEDQHHRQRRRGLGQASVQAENAETRASLARQLDALGERRALFSAELLANTQPEVVQAVHAFLARWCPDFLAVGYVRAPVGFMESVYQQHLKAGRAGFDLDKLYPRYRRRLRVFEELLGRERVQFWPFAPSRFPRGCVVRDFCTRLDIACGEADILRVNDSLSLDAIRLLYAYRRFGPGYGTGEQAMRENRELIARLRTLEGPKLRIDATAVRPVLDAHRKDIEWAEERLGQSFTERLSEGPECIREEADLLRFSRESLDWLAAQTGTAGLATDPSPQRVADAMQRMRVGVGAAPEPLWRRLRRRIGLG